jgi:hypothetical protein
MTYRGGKGKPRAEIGLVLRTLKSLRVSVDLKADSSHETPSISNATTPGINGVLDGLEKGHDESAYRPFGR